MPTPDFENLLQYFDPGVRARAQQYYEGGKVVIDEVSPGYISARVSGSSVYDVDIQWDEQGELSGYCDCPYFHDHEECKHLCAVMMKLSDGLPGDPPRQTKPVSSGPTVPVWGKLLKQLAASMQSEVDPVGAPTPLPAGKQIVYILDPGSARRPALTLELGTAKLSERGLTRVTSLRLARGDVDDLPEDVDRRILRMLLGSAKADSYYGFGYGYEDDYGVIPQRFRIYRSTMSEVLETICRSGRCFLRKGDRQFQRLEWDEGGAWELWIDVACDKQADACGLRGYLKRGEERMEVPDAEMMGEGLVCLRGKLARLDGRGAAHWLELLGQKRNLSVPLDQAEELVAELYRVPRLPRVQLPEDLRIEELHATPRPILLLRNLGDSSPPMLWAALSFDYAGHVVPAEQQQDTIYDSAQRRLVHRDRTLETAAAKLMSDLGFRWQQCYRPRGELPCLPVAKLPRVVQQLTAAGWRIEAEGKIYRQAGDFRLDVTSGIDWFDVNGSMQFGDQSASLPELLAAARSGTNLVRLGDGTFGVLPEEWARRQGLLAALGKEEEGQIRFTRSQAGLLDALLMAEPQVNVDEVFERTRQEMRGFRGIAAIDAPDGFHGTLREYQREGLGWMQFLRRFGFGGCLADDMGLGKTVQVLAMLLARVGAAGNNGDGEPRRPSLVVAPRSLVFNWRAEAERFAPSLRILDHSGIDRQKETLHHFADYDLVLTTYGTLRRDALLLKDAEFDYVILDESQAVKNSSTESAKAVRLLHARHRLALSGTPIENHLGELWSLFEFLNPGMLGAASIFKGIGAGGRSIDPGTAELLSRALRPFILRRTKQQVASELPEKTEQTLYCELEGRQRKQYDELRDHYRASLLAQVERDGLNRSKIQILEALLRLRQAACHPGLIDRERAAESSAKLDVLLPRISQVVEEGHKVLVFSQFTSLLGIVRQKLDADGLPYAYLDGKTRDRQERVERFQNDPDCRLFLISLKAGGLGLNLTAAEYVFLLDPWWNPAVEAQAIDRAHRIGQTRQVFAYRVIARDTVEEKVLQLQQTKRNLADSIINADNSLIRELKREDLELLLS